VLNVKGKRINDEGESYKLKTNKRCIDREKLKDAVIKSNIEWQRHALERMMQRGISRKAIKDVLLTGDIIEDYEDNTPFPSALILGWFKRKPLHVVVAFDPDTERCYVITAYKPDLEHFESDYKTRRSE
jgi:hypothetical protein